MKLEELKLKSFVTKADASRVLGASGSPCEPIPTLLICQTLSPEGDTCNPQESDNCVVG